MQEKDHSSPERVYNAKGKEPIQGKIDVQSTTSTDVIRIGSNYAVVKGCFKGMIIINDLAKPNEVDADCPFPPSANDHETSSSKSQSKYMQPRWCPIGLSNTKKRKMQRLRLKEKREKELEQQRDEFFNKICPMIPQKQWRVKSTVEV